MSSRSVVVASCRAPSKASYEECLHKHKTVFTGDERPGDRIQTSLSFALHCMPCAGATRGETFEYVVAAATGSDFFFFFFDKVNRLNVKWLLTCKKFVNLAYLNLGLFESRNVFTY